MQYSLISNDGVDVLTVLIAGVPHLATSDTHPNFKALVAKVLDNDESVVADFTIEKAVAQRFESLSERVSVAGGQVFFDGDPVNDSLTEQIIRFMDEGVEDWEPLVLFFEKVQQNPNAHSREQLYRWLARHKFTLTHEGDIVGYKGVQDDLTSVHAGPAIVDGVRVNGHVPNQPGSVITMPRNDVNFDPAVGCSTGLHVANWRYASGWGTKTLEVHVNPRDVVSVPTDSDDEKVRTCRYIVIDVVTEPYEGAVLTSEVEEDVETEICDTCGDYLSSCRGLCEDYDDEEYCSTCGGDCGWCPDEADEEEDTGSYIAAGFGAGKSNNLIVDTRLNYQNQQRDANGRFLPKN